MSKRIPATLISVALAFALCPTLAFAQDGELSAGQTANEQQATQPVAKYKPKWTTSKGYVYYKNEQGKRAKGLTEVGGKTYLFDSKGRQKTGWQRVKGTYRYFYPKNKAKGYLAKKRVVNGIKLDKDGKAHYTKTGKAELSIMIKAQKLVEKLNKPTYSEKKKLKKGFVWMRDKCAERELHGWSAAKGWHRSFALDVYNHRAGSCYSYGAAFAYYANAIGCKKCVVVSSGGHGWAEVNNKVYDVEWSRVTGKNYFAHSPSAGGGPAYSTSRAYTVKLNPRTSRW